MARRRSTKQAWARSGVVFAGTMMIMLGVWQLFVGIAAIADDDLFIVGPGYTYDLDTTAWGWIHLVLGALCAVAGFFLFSGAALARGVAIALAALSAINNFIFLPHYPLWALAVIALDVFVIWSLATVDFRSRAEEAASAQAGYYGAERSQPSGDRWPSNRPAASRQDEPARGATAPNATEVTETPPTGRR